MDNQSDESVITAYVLNEAEAAERAAFEERLANDEALRKETEAFRLIGPVITAALKEEQAPRLTLEQHRVIDTRIHELFGDVDTPVAPAVAKRPRWPYLVAAALLMAAGLWAFQSGLPVKPGRERNNRVAAAQALIQRISDALERYRAEHHELPPDTGYGLSPSDPASGAGKTYDAGSLWRHLGQKTHRDGKDFGPYMQFSSAELAAYADPVHGASFYVVDPWGTAIGYIGDSRRVIHNRGGFDIFSAGPDRKTGQDVIQQHGPNLAYDGVDNDGDGVADNATELGNAKFNGCLTVASGNDQVPRDALDDLNNWDPK
jgi:hypothetical protein